MRVLAHYVFSIAVMGIYGGAVCPFIATLSVVGWLVLLAVVFGMVLSVRLALDKHFLSKFPYESQTRTQFFLEMALFFAAGLIITAYNMAYHDFPAGSGAKMILGCIALGFFASADLALERERNISARLTREGKEIRLDEKYFPLTVKFSLVAIATVIIMTAVTYLMIAKDLWWIVREVGPDRLLSARRAVLVELVFVGGVVLAEIINLITSYSHNLKLFLDNQNSVLIAVAGGNLQTRVPVGTKDEFGFMARYTNKMITDLDERNKALRETQLEIVKRLGRAAEYRDNETGLHVIRMSLFSAHLGKAAGLSDEECEMLLQASPMHDIGKIGIPDQVLLKPEKLDKKEWEIMKTHTEIGKEILKGSKSPLLKMAEAIAISHQEKWDGSGYPRGLKGEEIPLMGRICAICDVFDALTSVRPYKKAWTVQEAMALLEKESGKHFDPKLVPLFKQVLPEILEIKERYSESHAM